MRNLHFSDAVRSEQELYENIVIESLQMYGQDVYYLPRDVVSKDIIFGDEVECCKVVHFLVPFLYIYTIPDSCDNFKY